MPVQIEILSGPRQGESVMLDSHVISVGDSQDDDIYFDPAENPAAKGHRAEFRLNDDGWQVRSLGIEPIIVNHATVTSVLQVCSGDIVRMSKNGPDVLFEIIGRSRISVASSKLTERPFPAVEQSDSLKPRFSQSGDGTRVDPLSPSKTRSWRKRFAFVGAIGLTLLAFAFVVSMSSVDYSRSQFELPKLADHSVEEGSILTLSAGVDSLENRDGLIYRLGMGAPKGMKIERTSGDIEWTPKEDDGPRTHRVTVILESIGRRKKEYDRESFSVHVLEKNSPPVVNSIPSQTIDVFEKQQFERIIEASDPDVPSNKLSYALGSDAPRDMTIDAETGRLSWSPKEDDIGRTFDIDVHVTDDGEDRLTDHMRFRISVVSSNPWLLVRKNAEKFIVLLGVEDRKTGGRFPFGTGCLIGRDTIVTSASVAVELHRYRKRDWNIWVYSPQEDSDVNVREIVVHALYLKLAESPSDQIYFDLAILRMDRAIGEACLMANDSEMDNLEAQDQLGCVGFDHDGERLNRFEQPIPLLQRIDVVSNVALQIGRSGPDSGAPRILFLAGQLVQHPYGSPILDRKGRLVAVYSERRADAASGDKEKQQIHYAPTAELVAAWLKGEGTEYWVSPDAIDAKTEASPSN